MQLESLINQNYSQLNENDKLVAKQIIIHQQEYAYLTCEKIAEECHISRATLLRLCRKIGLSSFSDLKYLLKTESKKQINNSYDFHDICINYQLLINELQKLSFDSVCKTIHQASTIYIYGTGNEQKSIAQEMKRIFLSVNKCVIDLFDAGEVEFMKHVFNKTDLFIIISLSGETPEGIDIIKNIHPYIHTLSMTRLDNNTIATLCEQNLYVATQKLNSYHFAAYEVVGAFYALLDLLFVNYIEYQRRLS